MQRGSDGQHFREGYACYAGQVVGADWLTATHRMAYHLPVASWRGIGHTTYKGQGSPSSPRRTAFRGQYDREIMFGLQALGKCGKPNPR